MPIQVRHEQKRGCGFRKPGGLYLVCEGPGIPCGKLPVPLEICPTCGGGIHFARAWTWVNATALLAEKPCNTPLRCSRCPLGGPLGRCGLLWIGGKYYPTPADWSREAAVQGVSRRIKAVPRGFKLGETWVLVAHIHCIQNPDDSYTAGIFHAFRPTAVEYIVKDDDTAEDIAALEERGITPIRLSEHPIYDAAEKA